MKNLTAIICLTIAVFLGSAGMAQAEGIWFAIKENPKCFAWNPSPEYPDKFSETATWDGTCLNGKANGKGKLIWKFKKNNIWQEQIFVGEYKNGKRHGQLAKQFIELSEKCHKQINADAVGWWKDEVRV